MEAKVEEAVEQALRFLRYSDRTIHEMKGKLRAKGFSDNIVDTAARKLIRLGLLDDRKYAEKWIRGRLRSRPIGRRLIDQKLRLKGIHPEVLAEILDPLYREFVESRGIEKLACRQVMKYKSVEGLKLRKKLFDFLFRRGFGYDECVSAVAHAASGKEDEDSEFPDE